MSYLIIFETKIVKLSDGRIIHFDRSGCNNDNAGRTKDDFSAKIYTIDEFMNKIVKLKQNSQPIKESSNNTSFDLKIGNRYVNSYDYGEHLLRMFKRALSYEDFINTMCFKVKHITGFELIKPERKLMSVEEFEKDVYKLLYSGNGFSYRQLSNYPDVHDEKGLIKLIEGGATLWFTIIKRKKNYK